MSVKYWNPWVGNGMPALLDGTKVQVLFRDGTFTQGFVDTFVWKHTGGINDIIAFRVVDEFAKQED